MPKSPAIPFKSHVFINCPFDDDYKALFRALVFAIHDCGFVARCSYEESGSGQNRLAKIIRIISECKYGIHDISRIELSVAGKLPRFNMPFETGLFWGCFAYGAKAQKSKQIMILDSIPFRYRETISDIAGQDPSFHNDDPREIIKIVNAWLVDNTPEILPGGEKMWEHYQEFETALPDICEDMSITMDEIISPKYFNRYVLAITTFLREKNYSS